ncbi:hypothetical protein EXIGLDRAFT_745915 [Exidia glandulosa HHB12029]|uniref:CoA-dependent acyltransferase n=1 Tax=Exidia glandulosa HHB12029 TaxID=1314781 RepID=A0A165MUH5_EXIGL|nr:hypothetical protein EXIGLDRAFT_745915 [Exidia glandulosa HHB12029]
MSLLSLFPLCSLAMHSGGARGGAPDVNVFECTANDLVGKAFILTFCFIVPAKLPIERLRSSLFSTVETTMQRAGARLVRRKGVLEFHIPSRFSESTPPCAFSSRHNDTLLAAQQLPLPPQPAHTDDARPRFMPALSQKDLAHFRPQPCPSSLVDFLKPNIPMLHVHLTTFEDATLLGITFPHILFDVHGLKTLLTAWTATLRGEADHIVPSPLDFAPLSREGTKRALEEADRGGQLEAKRDADEPIRGFFALSVWSTILFVIGLIWRIVTDSQEVDLLVRIPKPWLREKKNEIVQELKASGSDEWVSTSDVLLAWLFQTVHAHRKDDTPIALHSAVNLRTLLPNMFDAPFINNAVHAVVVRPPIAASQLATQPLRETALSLRRALQKLKEDTDQVLVELADVADHPNRVLFPARPGEEWAVATNWLSAAFLELEFVDGAGVRVRPTWFTGMHQEKVGLPLRGTGAVHCEDEHAIWAMWTMSRKDKVALEKFGVI